MSEALARQDKGSIVNFEDLAMSVEGLIKQVQLIQKVMHEVMKEGEHFGKIPGTNKPTLLKPGAEKLCLTFRLNPDYNIIREVREKDFLAYTVKCDLVHIPTGQKIASGVGSCNSKEVKYRYRFLEESTGQPVPKAYWEAKTKNDSKEMKRVLGEGNRASKIDGQWVIAKSERVENDNPWDLDNTIIKMACKRALVAATLNATAASDIFTQDLEDMEGVIDLKPEESRLEEAKPAQHETFTEAFEEGRQKGPEAPKPKQLTLQERKNKLMKDLTALNYDVEAVKNYVLVKTGVSKITTADEMKLCEDGLKELQPPERQAGERDD